MIGRFFARSMLPSYMKKARSFLLSLTRHRPSKGMVLYIFTRPIEKGLLKFIRAYKLGTESF